MTDSSYPDGAVVHTVIIAWRPGSVDSLFVERVSSELREVATECDGVLDYRIGSDLGWHPDNGDFAVTAVFADPAAFNAYASNDKHVRIATEDLLPNAERHLGIQFEI